MNREGRQRDIEVYKILPGSVGRVSDLNPYPSPSFGLRSGDDPGIQEGSARLNHRTLGVFADRIYHQLGPNVTFF